MAYYRICPHCGGALDPEESCDCREQSRMEAEKWQKRMIPEADGQYQMIFAGTERKISKPVYAFGME